MSNSGPDSLHNGQSSRLGSSGSSKNNAPNKPKKVPHYLRTSTGSCHDTCKYGSGGHREEEMRKPLRKIWPKSSTNVVKSAEMAVPGKPKLEKVINRKTAALGTSARKTVVSLSASFRTPSSTLRENGRLKSSSPVRHRRRMHGVEIEASHSNDSEKTLHIVETRVGINTAEYTLPSLPSSSMSTSPPLSSPHSISTLFPDKDGQVIQRCQPVKDRNNQTSRNCQEIVSKSSPPNPFRNRREVLPQPTVMNRPRRLTFRTPRFLEAEYGKKPAGGRDDPGPISCLKVELKHQEVQRKEEKRRLFNNVIEETANKLALSRKSKVKALVGAFETVISLQEDNTCSHNVS